MVLEVKNRDQGGSRLPPGVQRWNKQVTCSSLTPWGISASLKRGFKVYFGPGPNLVMVLEVKNRNQGGFHSATWGPAVELTGYMFFSYPMEDFCVIKTWVQSVLWPRTQLGDGDGVQKS